MFQSLKRRLLDCIANNPEPDSALLRVAKLQDHSRRLTALLIQITDLDCKIWFAVIQPVDGHYLPQRYPAILLA